ncbi:Uracil phosphoribosyltransferase [Mycoplasma suis KI3806]|uniref:Uracil phosphoribosyltransferase n=1 Tax=Mycoplasma suis (strain KI_3806) TaxID=708248 RepID=F0V2L3_MYCS3|nr:uracil phosphoribosyltransferase [Mycoplasma suis]CBZ40894.1 Uracil phosphoribosyltransferase [Mycoplasma suis KI3806]
MPVYITENNLVKSFITKVRNKESNSVVFGENLKKITLALALEANKEFALVDQTIETPLRECVAKKIDSSVIVVPVMRSGLIMSEALKTLFEDCAVIHLGIYRDENLQANRYYAKEPANLTSSTNKKVILCDPLIATGNTLKEALGILKDYNFEDIFVLGVIMSERAKNELTSEFPNLNIYVAEVDKELNDHGYIVPGVGDAGDRLFGTK